MHDFRETDSETDFCIRIALSLERVVPNIWSFRDALKGIRSRSPHLTPRDLMWLGADAAGTASAPLVLRHRGEVDGTYLLKAFGLGVGIIAATCPDLVRLCGHQPRSLALAINVITQQEGVLIPDGDLTPEEKAAVARRVSAEVAKAHGVAYSDWLDWLDTRFKPSRVAFDAAPSSRDDDVHIAIWVQNLELAFSPPVQRSREDTDRALRSVARSRGVSDMTSSKEAIESLFGMELVAELTPEQASKTVFVVGADGKYQLNARDFLDRAFSFQDMKRPRDDELNTRSMDTSALPGDDDARGPMSVPSDVPDPSAPSEEADDAAALIRVLELAALDEKDRQDVALIRDLVSSRRERARRIKMSERALQKREDKLIDRAIARASPSVAARLREMRGRPAGTRE